ncbi:MAG TPA: hypothetical protein VK604_13395 [Bryobacteraceae bacterium]|nr:hypothetical protein [Bryobacteraceae bacterium]
MIQFLSFSDSVVDAAKAFNRRITRDGKAPFLLPEQLDQRPRSGAIRGTHYLAMEGTEARGGYMLVEYPSVLKGERVTVANIQSPISESIIDSRFAMLPLQMVKQFLSHNRHCFVVGMGDQGNPLPRLLRASGWSLESVPFFFRIHRMPAFLAGMPALQSPWWKRAGTLAAAYSGAGAVGGMLLQRSKVRLAEGASISLENVWGEWAEEVWAGFAPTLRFGVRRDLEVLRELYPADDGRLRIHRITSGSRTLGWSASLVKRMQNSPYFGNLMVASLLDCAALPGYFGVVAALADGALGKEGADLVITNQSLTEWKDAFAAAGFRSGPSRFQVAISSELTKGLSKTPVADGAVHITRGDGDGRLNL